MKLPSIAADAKVVNTCSAYDVVEAAVTALSVPECRLASDAGKPKPFNSCVN